MSDEGDRGRLAGEFMAHRAANRTDPPKIDMRSPKSKQVRAGDNPPRSVAVIGGVAGVQFNENFAHGFRPGNSTQHRVNQTGVAGARH
jgi:hypothetical protein